MASNNFVHVVGKLIKFEERTTGSGKRVCALTLVVQNGRPGGEGSKDDGHFIDVESWEISPQLAQLLAKKVKDCRVAVTGRLKLDRWQAKDGTNRSALRVVGDVITYIPYDESRAQRSDSARPANPTHHSSPAPADVDESDVPF